MTDPTDQLSLFPRYPATPGAKGTDTSRMAADAIASMAPTLRALVLTEFKMVGAAGLTADEVTERLGLEVLSVRPRVSELVKMGLLVRAMIPRRMNTSGRTGAVWCCKENR